MEIILAKSAGFCFGVKNAVDIVDKLVDEKKVDIFTYGPIIHNYQVVRRFESLGVFSIDDVNELKNGDNIVIRAHGVAPKVYEKIKEKNATLHEATCPYVKKIHRLVDQKYKDGYQIIIVGDKNHPEVIGIKGWCNEDAIVVNSIEHVQNLKIENTKICVVAQTTLVFEKWKLITDSIEMSYKNVEKYDTICCETGKRQEEARRIAQNVDTMIVIGDKNSSNTQKLFEICKEWCNETYKIETAGEIPPLNFKKINKIGITAGASTPDEVIEEVIGKMDELNKDENLESCDVDFLEAYESTFVSIRAGEIIKGKIIGFNKQEVFVDVGYKSDGIIPRDEYSEYGELDTSKIKAGDIIEVFIVKVNDGDGNVILSKKRVDAFKSWDDVVLAYEKQETLSAKILEVVKGGAIALFKGIKVFIPASLISDKFITNLDQFLGTVARFKIIELNEKKRKVVGSQKAVMIEEKKESVGNIWSTIEIGQKYEGTVKNITKFGAFVDIGGVDGLIHISELSWNKVSHPSDILKVDEKVEVVVKELNREKKKLSFGFKKAESNPWNKIISKVQVGDVIKVKVVRMMPFGAFAELEPGVDGLIHISQISEKRLAKPDEVLSIGQEVEVKVMEIDQDNKKINLSMRELIAKEEELKEEDKIPEEKINLTIADSIKPSK